MDGKVVFSFRMRRSVLNALRVKALKQKRGVTQLAREAVERCVYGSPPS